MTNERYLAVPAMSLKYGDRILECATEVTSVKDQTTKTIALTELNLFVLNTKWVDSEGNYRVIRALVVHQNGDEEFYFLRARSLVRIMRRVELTPQERSDMDQRLHQQASYRRRSKPIGRKSDN